MIIHYLPRYKKKSNAKDTFIRTCLFTDNPEYLIIADVHYIPYFQRDFEIKDTLIKDYSYTCEVMQSDI